jgi:uncharacterized glyoxalase superfamily protein PhnB
MSTRPAKPDVSPWLTPYLIVRDVQASADLYRRAFGFTVGDIMPGPDGRPVHADLRYKGQAVVMMGAEGAMGMDLQAPATSGAQVPISLYVYCDDVDALYAQACKAGMRSSTAPTDMFWGDRMCALEDPDGYRWSFATNVGEFDPSKMPQA